LVIRLGTNVKIGEFTTVKDAEIGDNTVIWHHCNLYGCKIGSDCTIGSYVEIGPGVKVGNKCRIEAFAFICSGVTLEDEVFVGPHVTFTNDKYPKAVGRWTLLPVLVKNGASIGANATIVCGVTIGEKSMIAAGSIITKDVPSNVRVAGNPAKLMMSRIDGKGDKRVV
jgi:UDP-2-acetamido-3-amino-2,3-dideoxy-glucuronate N-acetyltransferase